MKRRRPAILRAGEARTDRGVVRIIRRARLPRWHYARIVAQSAGDTITYAEAARMIRLFVVGIAEALEGRSEATLRALFAGIVSRKPAPARAARRGGDPKGDLK
jgi:hypothetical protein